MRVSVIVPVYNVADYVDRCLESITSQTYDDIEIVVIDDGSTDGSGQKCKEWEKKDNRIRFFAQSNYGVSVARNAGLAKSTGDYIAFVDGDDYLEITFIEEMINCASRGDGTEIVFCGYKYFSDGRVDEYGFFNEDKDFTKSDREMLICRAIGVYDESIKRKTHIGTPWAKLYNASFIRDNNIVFEPGMSRMQDLIFNIKCFKAMSKGKYIDKKLYTYVQRPSSTANKYNENYENEALQIISKLKENTIDLSEKVNEAVKYKAVLLFIEAVRLKYAKKECNLTIFEKKKEIARMSKIEPFKSSVEYKYSHISNSFGRNAFLFFARNNMFLMAYCLVLFKYRGK